MKVNATKVHLVKIFDSVQPNIMTTVLVLLGDMCVKYIGKMI